MYHLQVENGPVASRLTTDFERHPTVVVILTTDARGCMSMFPSDCTEIQGAQAQTIWWLESTTTWLLPVDYPVFWSYSGEVAAINWRHPLKAFESYIPRKKYTPKFNTSPMKAMDSLNRLLIASFLAPCKILQGLDSLILLFPRSSVPDATQQPTTTKKTSHSNEWWSGNTNPKMYPPWNYRPWKWMVGRWHFL